jgi:hypothetical protein
MTSNHHIYCLECIPDMEAPHQSVILPALENLALHYGVTNVYATCDSIEGFEASISTLVYEDRSFKDYTIIYLVFEGSGNELKIDNYYYSFEEIAEFFEGKLTGKIVHFANTMLLDLEPTTAQYFIDVTGAKAISGYGNQLPVLSTVLDNLYFALAEDHDDAVELVEVLYEKQYALCEAMGFRLYY